MLYALDYERDCYGIRFWYRYTKWTIESQLLLGRIELATLKELIENNNMSYVRIWKF